MSPSPPGISRATRKNLKMHRTRGNLLLSALFMAAFLFFLSVALVVTNREDIRYTLFVDHKMRSSLAADGALDAALQVMRSQPDWESQISNLPIQFASGAASRVVWRPWTAPPAGGDARYQVPRMTTRLPAVEVVASGISGAFRSDRHLLLEEFRIADSVLSEGRKPHLFAVIDDKLEVLTPSFTWEGVGELDAEYLINTLSAGGDALHYLARERGATPPELMDFPLTVTPEGVRIPGEFSAAPIQIPKGHGGLGLVLKEAQWDWETLPDPGEQLGTRVDSNVKPDPSGKAEASAGGKGWDNMTLSWDTIALSPSDLTVDYSFFNGPRLEWYNLAGTVAAFHQGKYYCHGKHYFYSGFRYKNSESPGGMVRSQGKEPSLFEEPCILEYNAESKKWRPILDYLKVTDPELEPTIVDGVRPDIHALMVDEDGKVYTREAGSSSPQWWRVADEKLISASELPAQAQIHLFRKDKLTLQPRLGAQVPAGLLQLSNYDIAGYLPESLPARNDGPINPEAVGTMNSNEPRLEFFWSYQPALMTSFKTDLYCLVQCTSRYQLPDKPEPVVQQTRCLAHFDGETWQLLPAGFGLLLPSTSSYRSEVKLGYGGGLGKVTTAQRLILGGYATDRPLLRRYVPVARWGPG